jgi:DNA-binding GntR family transcriptional regulator
MTTFKYKIIYNEILKYILTSRWPVGSYMKSENELIKIFKVSRLTIRNVLSLLENEGRIKRSRGKKTLILNRLLGKSSDSSIKDFSVDLKHYYSLEEFKIISNHLKDKFPSTILLYYI